MKRYITIIFSIGLAIQLIGQNSNNILTYQDFIATVKNNHPVAQKADLLVPKGQQIVRSAQGGFDPQLFTDFNQKAFDEKDYFRLFSGGVKVPTNFGAEFKVGYDYNQGEFLNAENYLPSAGLAYAGVSMPLLQGLVIDQRRATLQQADIFATMTLVERRKLMNDLIFDAAKGYWNWTKAGNEYAVYQQAVNLAKIRLEAVKITFEQGDKPAIDTLEAFIQWQDRQVQANKAYVKFQKATLELSNFLWNNNEPLQLQPNVQPPQLSTLSSTQDWSADTIVQRIQGLNNFHPDLLLYDLKLKNLDVDRRWKQEKLKPKLNLNYNFMLEPTGSEDAANVSLNNFKWGLNFKYPIPNRTARADLQLNAIKVQETQLDRSQKRQELTNKAQYYYVQINNLLEQIALSNNNIANYQRLLNAERLKFDIGESSLFLVNSRENKLIDAQLKLLELKAKFQAERVALDWALGRLE